MVEMNISVQARYDDVNDFFVVVVVVGFSLKKCV